MMCVSEPDMIVTSDASLTVWGCDCEGVQSGGHWSPAEKTFHINYLEIKAAFFALKCFLSQLQNKHVRLMLDNVTAVSCVNRMGSNHCFLQCNNTGSEADARQCDSSFLPQSHG